MNLFVIIRLSFVFIRIFKKLLTFVDPGLHADHSVSRPRFCQSEIDIGPERVERNFPARQPFAPRHLSAAQAAADFDFHPLDSLVGLYLIEHRFEHAPERQTLLQLFSYLLADQHRIGLRTLHFLDVYLEIYFLAGKKPLFDGSGQIFDTGTAAADQYARASRMNDETHRVSITLDLYRGNRGRLPLVHHKLPDLDVLAQLLPVCFLAPVPA